MNITLEDSTDIIQQGCGNARNLFATYLSLICSVGGFELHLPLGQLRLYNYMPHCLSVSARKSCAFPIFPLYWFLHIKFFCIFFCVFAAYCGAIFFILKSWLCQRINIYNVWRKVMVNEKVKVVECTTRVQGLPLGTTATLPVWPSAQKMGPKYLTNQTRES